MSGERRGPVEPVDLDARFDAELTRAARALVSEELPRGVLDEALAPGGGPIGTVRARRAMPAYAGLAAALVLLLAAGVALLPAGSSPASPSPAASGHPSAQPSDGASATVGTPGTFRTTAQIRADFGRLAYTCVTGKELLATGPSPSAPVLESAVCTAPADAGPYKSVVVVAEAADGRVVQLLVKANLTIEDSPSAREAIAVPLAKAVAIAVAGQATANELAAWLVDTVGVLPAGSANSTELDGFKLRLDRSSSGGYVVTLLPR